MFPLMSRIRNMQAAAAAADAGGVVSVTALAIFFAAMFTSITVTRDCASLEAWKLTACRLVARLR